MMTSSSPLAQVEPAATARQSPEAPEYSSVLIDWMAHQGLLKASREGP